MGTSESQKEQNPKNSFGKTGPSKQAEMKNAAKKAESEAPNGQWSNKGNGAKEKKSKKLNFWESLAVANTAMHGINTALNVARFFG